MGRKHLVNIVFIVATLGCVENSTNHSDCVAHSDCDPSICIEGKCVDITGGTSDTSPAETDGGSGDLPAGSPCVETSDCARGVCVPLPGEQDPICLDLCNDGRCGPGYQCMDTYCIPYSSMGNRDTGAPNLADGGLNPQRDLGGTPPDNPPLSDAGLRPEDASMARECMPDETRCVGEMVDVQEICRPDGQWAVQPCANNETCRDGRCAPVPIACQPGERDCSANGRPRICSDGQWVPTEPCEGGYQCVDGRCLTDACAAPARSGSYLGCDFLALDLPNSAFDDRDADRDGSPDGTTVDAPLGIIVANPSAVEPVGITLRHANGQLQPLVGRQLIEVPNIGALGERYQDQTVRSHITDANGQIIRQEFDVADAIEIPPGGQGTFLISRQMGPLNASSLRPDAIRIVTDRPVVGYQMSPYCCNYSFSNEASLLLPITALGTRYTFLGTPYLQTRDAFNNVVIGNPPTIAVISPTDDNEVTVRLPPGMRIARDGTDTVRQEGDSVTTTIGRQEVLLVTADAMPAPGDLTGADITSEAPVAVFSSHFCSNYPELLFACDHLQEQLFPMNTWGDNFLLAPLQERNPNSPTEVIYWKVLAGVQITRFELSVPFEQLNPLPPGFDITPYCGDRLENERTLILQPGQHCEFGTKHAAKFAADRPATIMGVIAGQQSTGLESFGEFAGDPSMFGAVSTEKYRSAYTFITPAHYTRSYITMITRAGNEITLDGNPLPMADATPIDGSVWLFKHWSVEAGVHKLSAQTPIGLVIYGYDDFVSYALPAGFDLAP